MAKLRVIGLLFLGLYPVTAFAYMDPNVGGVLFQWLAPIFAVLVMVWGRVKDRVSSLLRRIRNLFSRRP